MSTAAAQRPRVAIDDYLAREATAERKHILWDGEVFSFEDMSGGSPAHNTVCANVIVALRGARCRVMTSDQKVWVPRKEGFVYPDATVVCGPLALYPGSSDVVTNPTLLVEVLSEGTERFDRGEKFEGYRAIPSLRHYLMVSSRHVLVEHYVRADEHAWTLRGNGPRETLRLQGPDVTLAVDELYAMVFDEP
jgi:Uma2 family endonuclease